MAKKKKEEVVEAPVEEEILEIETLTGVGGFNPDRVRMMVYGESGIGKTRFASTWPNVLFLDIDDGMASVTEPVDRIFIEEWDQMWDAFMYLSEEPDHGYTTVVVDSLNEAQVLALQHTVREYPGMRRAYDSLASQSDYGKMLADFDSMARYFKSLPIHLVLIGQVGDKLYDTDVIKPQLIGKHSARNICRMMDIVGYMYREKGEPVIGFNLEEFVCKDRSGRLPESVTKPTHRKLSRHWAPSKGTKKPKG